MDEIKALRELCGLSLLYRNLRAVKLLGDGRVEVEFFEPASPPQPSAELSSRVKAQVRMRPSIYEPIDPGSGGERGPDPDTDE